MSRELSSLESVTTLHKQLTNEELDLSQQLAKAERRKQTRSLFLTLPLVCFILLTFAFPILEMLHRSVDNSSVVNALPQTSVAIVEWQAGSKPSDHVSNLFAQEIKALYLAKTLPKLANRLNIEMAGMRSLLMKTGRKLSKLDGEAVSYAQLVAIDKRWAKAKYWGAIKNLNSSYTSHFYLSALDLKVDESGSIVQQVESRRIYLGLFYKTIWMSLVITVVCLILAYPLAYLLANLPDKRANLLLIVVLLPFWTSLLVRTTSWIVLLQNQGVVNDLLVWLGVIDERLSLIHNTFGTVVAMVHILLPFMILPLYSVMKGISPTYFRAARSLGATPRIAFTQVYMPLTLPGVGAGCLLTFILSIGFYITPALVGGRSGQMISNMIAYHMQTSLNWGMAGALGGLLLVLVLGLFYLFNRVVGINNLRVGG
ncbi:MULTISPECIES: ABC transporter permease [Vibrio]|uniref:ABC transporter permease n=1 Tax=Vibrio qingdaonensis TaxID=2829491 RepID=A0A9X3CT06_9VIBR|nr:ABC transporter permease [Vibrio qingdaonensis]MCW8347925.1 ABC transporter permease [Vibrio qingdaonensis]